jgi:hypothetical protein
MGALKWANLALRFVLELCLLAAAGYWGFKAGNGTIVKFVLGLGAPVLVAVVWGTFMSPQARVRLSRPLHLGMEVVLFGVGVAALFVTGRPVLAVLLAVVAVVNRVLIAAWGQESISHGRKAGG